MSSPPLSPEITALIDQLAVAFADEYLTAKAAPALAEGEQRTKPDPLPTLPQAA